MTKPQAFECRKLEDGEVKMMAAVAAAVSDTARERLVRAVWRGVA
jgi:hypothetical protein